MFVSIVWPSLFLPTSSAAPSSGVEQEKCKLPRERERERERVCVCVCGGGHLLREKGPSGRKKQPSSWNWEGNGNPLQYPCLENSTDRETWRAAVHGITKTQPRLSTLAWNYQAIWEDSCFLLAVKGGKQNWKFSKLGTPCSPFQPQGHTLRL